MGDDESIDDWESGGDDESAGDWSEQDQGDADDADEPGAREVAREEREAMYPMTGYVLVRVDYEEPPGAALTAVAQYGSLSSVELPTDGPITTYVVSDADGNAYDRDAVENASDR
jgi:hypothetical protein